ncbi:FISUMP domain-containing protein [Flavobacterium sp. ZT3R17]|uniref:fibrobacter succinogenes major paralogous domain-containing protein n=1 Tax=Flavobacterium cryoconiti TaxID=3398736 RepID=UPI003A85C8A1
MKNPKSILIVLFALFLIVGCSTSNDSNEKPPTPNAPNETSITVTDTDGNIYQTVTICNQVWTKTNLNVSHYRNGDVIPQVTDPTEWVNLTTGAWCYYNNETANGTTYGKLYNWYAVNDSRGLAPNGWHVSTDAEWTTLGNCLQGAVAGKMKEAGTAHWASPNIDATNSSNFTGLPGGLRYFYNGSGVFRAIGNYGYWWTSSEYNATLAMPRYLGQYLSNSYSSHDFDKYNGFSVRCLKD